MFETILFLGLPITDSYRNKLDLAPAPQRDLFIQEGQGSPYLQEIESKGVRYLGKELTLPAEVGALDLAAAHILSLLHNLVPHVHYKESSLVLVAIIPQSSESPSS